MELQELYEHLEEEKRLFHGYTSQAEYLATMHYIHRYANTQTQILEIGTGCDAYSLALAKEGRSLTAVGPVKKYVQIMESRKVRDMDITILECDATHPPGDWNSKFDIVLCFGPLCHLSKTQEQLQVIETTCRVCKNKGILMFTYIPRDMVMATGTMHVEGSLTEDEFDTKALQLHDDPFVFHNEQSVDELFHPFPLEKLRRVTTGSLTELMSERTNRFTAEEFQVWMRYHLKTCEEPSFLGHGNHNLFITRKNSR